MKTKVYYRIALLLFSLAIIGTIGNSIINYDDVVLKFDKLGYPSYLIYFIAVSQILGLSIIIANKTKWLLEWAYAGFFMNFIFGIFAHLLAKDGNGATAVICLVLVWVTYIQNKKLNYSKNRNNKKINETPQLKKVA